MKKLGLVGGTGPESTIPYYRDIVYGVQKRLARPVFPPVVIDSIDVFQVLAFCRSRDYRGLAGYVSRSISALAAAGADFAALTGNTPHIVFQELSRRSPIPLISSVDTACRAARDRGFRKLLLLGTAFTMEEDFFKAPFRAAGIQLVLPPPEARRWIHEKISSELELGIKKADTLDGFRRIIQSARERDGAEAVILGCTELPLLLSDEVSPLPCLDTLSIHVSALIDEILQGESL